MQASPSATAEPVAARGTHPGRRIQWLPVLTFILATFVFMPKALLGLGVFGPYDILEMSSPWRDAFATSPHIANVVQNDILMAMPVIRAVVDAVRHGHWLVWSPYVAGGEPIGAEPLSRVQSVFNLLLVMLPLGYGLGFVVAVQLLFSQTFFYLFLRRLGVRVSIATFGAVGYTFCGTNIALLERFTAYMILPALLWAVTRILDRRRPVDVALLGVFGAMSWLEGFPAAFVNSVAIAALLAVMLAVRRPAGSLGARPIVRQTVTGLALVGCGFALSGGLAAFSVLPFDHIMVDSGLLQQRQYTSALHLPSELIPAYLSVGALGDPQSPVVMRSRTPTGAVTGAGNAVELESGSGLVVATLALVGMLLSVAGRVRFAARQRAAYIFALVAVVGGIVLVNFDTPLLKLFYALPLIGSSPVNRLRIIVNIGLVMLACLGLEGFARHRRESAASPAVATEPPPTRPRDWTSAISAAAALLALAYIMVKAWPGYGHWLASEFGSNVRRELAFEAAGSLLVTVGAYVALGRRWSAKRSAMVAAGVGAGLTAAMFATVAFPLRNFIPTVNSNLFYPTTPGHTELARLTGNEYRILGSDLAPFYSSTSLDYGYLDVRGISMTDPSFRRLVEAAIPDAWSLDKFKIILNPGDPVRFDSPVLDDLGIRYVVYGTNEAPLAHGTTIKPPVGTRPLPGSAPLGRTVRSVGSLTGFTIPIERGSGQDVCSGTRLIMRASTSSGMPLRESVRPAVDAPQGFAGNLTFPMTDGAAPRGTLVRASVSLSGPPCSIAAGVDSSGALDVGQLLRARGDLPIVSTDEGIFYERTHAHAIAWLANRWRPAGTRAAALALATAPDRRPDDAVPVAGAGTPDSAAAAGAVSTIRYARDGFDVKLSTAARNVLATGFVGRPSDWSVAVDGQPSRVASVDGILLGAVVPPGTHTVSFRYQVPDLALGLALTALSVVALAGLLAVDPIRSRRRRRRGT